MQHLVHAKTIPAALPRHSQRGVTLIELMVGILIGMLVVAVALLTLSSTRSSSVVVNDVTRLEQQTNMTMDVIGQQIKQAGAMNVVPSLVGAATGKVEFENFATLNGADLGTRKVIVTGSDGADGAPDTLTISYSEPINGGMSQNCSGTNPVAYPLTPVAGPAPTATSQQVVSTLSVDDGNLTCGVIGVAGTTQPLATNVADFQVRYLVNDGVNPVTTRTATQVGANWTGIDGVEVCLHLTGESSQTAPAAPSFVDCSGNAIAADGRLHRVARNTFRLRNSASL